MTGLTPEIAAEAASRERADVALRATEERDLPRISDLTESVFGRRRRVELLRWLLGDLRRTGRVESWVAERDGKILGHVAILQCRYRAASGWLTGVHPYLWMVEEAERGRAGVRLGGLIRDYEDFQIVLGGTAITKAIVRGRRFIQATEAWELRLVGGGRKTSGFELVPIGSFAAIPTAAPAPGIQLNEAAPDHLDWQAACPDLESHRFELRRDGRPVGPVLVFVERSPGCTAAGRLVHLPYLDEDPASWAPALDTVASVLGDLGCGSWTLLASHPALVRACRQREAEVAGRRPVWIREHEAILAEWPWHLTYLEGDLAYRRVAPEEPAA